LLNNRKKRIEITSSIFSLQSSITTQRMSMVEEQQKRITEMEIEKENEKLSQLDIVKRLENQLFNIE